MKASSPLPGLRHLGGEPGVGARLRRPNRGGATWARLGLNHPQCIRAHRHRSRTSDDGDRDALSQAQALRAGLDEKTTCAPVAQIWIEQGTPKPKVARSSRAGRKILGGRLPLGAPEQEGPLGALAKPLLEPVRRRLRAPFPYDSVGCRTDRRSVYFMFGGAA